MISNPFSFEHVSHIDKECTYGVKNSLNIDPSKIGEYLPRGSHIVNLENPLEIEDRSEDVKSKFKSSIAGSIKQIRAFSFNKTPPTTPFKTHLRRVSSISIISKGGDSTSSPRLSSQSMSSVDYSASPIRKVSVPCTPLYEDLQGEQENTIVDLKSGDCLDQETTDLSQKFNSISKPPNVPNVVLKLPPKEVLNDIPIDSDSDDDDDDFQLDNCYLPVDHLIGELKRSPIRITNVGASVSISPTPKPKARIAGTQKSIKGDNLLQYRERDSMMFGSNEDELVEILDDLKLKEESQVDFFGELDFGESWADEADEIYK